jgi:hypothetical protein
MADRQEPTDWTQAPPSKPKGNFALISFALLALVLGGGISFYQLNGGGKALVIEKCCDEILLGPKAALFVRAQTNVRTKPSLTEGRTAYTYNRGVTVMGEVVMGEDGKSRWLKQQGDGWYILTRDLSTGSPPRLTGTLPDKSMTSGAPLEVRQIPKANAPIMVTLPAGTKVQMVGTELSGFTEIVFDHPTYRVGYVQKGSK